MATTFTFEEVAQEPATFTFEDLQTNKAPVKAQPVPTQAREFQFSDILAVPAAIGEVGLQMGTGLASQVAGGYRGLTSILSGEGVDEAARKVTEVTEGGTYQPQTPLGQGASQAVAYPFQKGMELTKQAGGAIGGAIGGEQGRIAGEAIGEQVIPVAATVAPLKPVLQGALSRPSAAKMSSKIEEINRIAPKVIVAKEGQSAGFVFDPAEVNPTRMNKTLAAYAGDQKLDFLAAEKNLQAAQSQIKKAIGLDQDVSLNQQTVKSVRDKLGERYEEVRKVGALPSNDVLATKLRNSLIEEIPGVETAARTANRVLLDNADAIASGELTGNSALNRIKEYRKLNQKIRDSGASDEAALLKGEAYLKVANILEDVIESGIKDKTVLDNFRKAREGIAKTYTVDAIINPETGVPNLSRLTIGKLKDAPLTDELALLRRIANTFPEATASISKYGDAITTLPRTGFGGSAGAAVGAATGNTAMGSIVGAVTGVLGGKALRNKLLSERYQRKNLLPEYAKNLIREDGDITIQSPLTQSIPRAVPPAPNSQGLSLAPVGEPLLPPSATVPQPASSTLRPSDLLSINWGRDVVGNRAKTPSIDVAGIDFPLSPAARPLYQRGGIAPEPRLPTAPFSLEGLPKQLPDVPPVLPTVVDKTRVLPSLPPSIQGNYPVLGIRDLQLGGQRPTPLPTLPPIERGLLGMAEEVAPSRKINVETVNFPLRQEKAMEITQDFLRERSIIETAIRTAPESQKRGLIADLRRITQEFTDVLAKNGMTPEEAMGLMRLYQSKEGTRFPVQKTFSGMLRKD